MAAPAGAAAEVPVLLYLVIGLLAMVVWVVCRGLRGVWIHTFGAMLLSLADVLNYDKRFIHIHFGGPIEGINNAVLNAITKVAEKSEHTMGYFFHGAAVIQGWVARELKGLAIDTLHWATWLQHSHLPKWVKALIYAAFPPLLIARLVKAAIAANLPHIGRVVITKVEHSVVTRVVRIAHATAGAVALPGWVIHLPHRLRGLEHDFTHVWRRLRKLELLLGATGAAALVARALGGIAPRCLRSGNVGRVARRLCGMDSSLIDLLLLDTLAVLSVVSVVEFAKDLQVIEDEAVGILGNLISEFPSA